MAGNVAAFAPNAFMRVLSQRNLLAGPARLAVLWSCLASLFLGGGLLVAGLLVELLVDRGELEQVLSRDEAQQFERLTGVKLAEPASVDTPIVAKFEDDGVLPTIWRTRRYWWNPLLAALYRRGWLPHGNNLNALCVLLGVGAAFLLARLWCLSRMRYQCRRAALDYASMLRRQLHRQVLRLGPEDLDGHDTTLALHLFQDQVERVHTALNDWLKSTLHLPFDLLVLTIAALTINPLLTLQWLFPLAMVWYLVGRGEAAAAATRQLAEDRSRRELASLGAALNHARLVRGYGFEDAELTQFQANLVRFQEQQRIAGRTRDDAFWLRIVTMGLCAILGALMLFLLGAKCLNKSTDLTIADATIFVAVFAIGGWIFRQLARLQAIRDQVLVAADQIFRFIDRTPSVSQPVGAKFLQPLSQAIHFERVSFRHGQKLLLDQLDLRLEAGKTYCIVSLNPLEAKSLAFLLPRYIEPQSGRVLINGEDIAWVTLESLRAEAIFVGADEPLFAGSVLDNLRGGRSQINLSQATEAAKAAHAHNFIVKLEQGYDTQLTDGDQVFDLGQRFRLSLARAILRDPALLIIEEPILSSDDDTKKLLEDTYDRLAEGRTLIFLPNRLSTLRRANGIILLHQGRVEDYGSQSLLVAESAIYRHWEYVHFNEFRHQPS